ncbi:hypothetical protein HBI11_001410 [Parastagonospora nodorum]|nr:hypothetical protein HBI11_001410 [Parastagonospora nodorum]
MMFLLELLALVALLIFMLLVARICSLEQCVSTPQAALEAAGHSLPPVGIPTDYRGDYEAAKDTIRGLRTIIDDLRRTIGHLEGLAHPCDHDDDLAALQQTIFALQRQLADAERELKQSRATCAEKSAWIRALLVDQQVQIGAIDVEQAKIARLELTIRDQNTRLWQLNVVSDQFNHVKELIHQMVAAGGFLMVVASLFVGHLALFGGVDLAGLGVDHLKLESYYAYARALADGLPCPLFPQEGFRLKGIQYPLSGLRVVGSRIVEPFTTFLAAGSVASPPPVALASAPTPSSLIFDFVAPEQQAPTPAPRPSGPSPAFLAPVPSALLPSAPAPSAPGPFAPARVARPAGPPPNLFALFPAALAPGPSAPAAAPAFAPAAPSVPAKNQAASLGFAVGKKPGSFGVRKP